MNTKKLVTALVGVPLVAMSSLVFAAEPMQLSDAQMDGVTAGGIADSWATAIALGHSVSTMAAATARTQVMLTLHAEITTINGVGSLSTALSSSSAL